MESDQQKIERLIHENRTLTATVERLDKEVIALKAKPKTLAERLASSFAALEERAKTIGADPVVAKMSAELDAAYRQRDEMAKANAGLAMKTLDMCLALKKAGANLDVEPAVEIERMAKERDGLRVDREELLRRHDALHNAATVANQELDAAGIAHVEGGLSSLAERINVLRKSHSSLALDRENAKIVGETSDILTKNGFQTPTDIRERVSQVIVAMYEAQDIARSAKEKADHRDRAWGAAIGERDAARAAARTAEGIAETREKVIRDAIRQLDAAGVYGFLHERIACVIERMKLAESTLATRSKFEINASPVVRMGSGVAVFACRGCRRDVGVEFVHCGDCTTQATSKFEKEIEAARRRLAPYVTKTPSDFVASLPSLNEMVERIIQLKDQTQTYLDGYDTVCTKARNALTRARIDEKYGANNLEARINDLAGRVTRANGAAESANRANQTINEMCGRAHAEMNAVGIAHGDGSIHDRVAKTTIALLDERRATRELKAKIRSFVES